MGRGGCANFSHSLSSLFDWLTFEDTMDRLSRNISKELPLYAAHYLRRVLISHDFAMQALVWFCMVLFRLIQFGAVWFGASYANLRPSHIFKRQILGKNLILHSSKYASNNS